MTTEYSGPAEGHTAEAKNQADAAHGVAGPPGKCACPHEAHGSEGCGNPAVTGSEFCPECRPGMVRSG